MHVGLDEDLYKDEHPFYLTDDSSDTNHKFVFTCDGTINGGIVGDQSFTVDFSRLRIDRKVKYVCTSHSTMKEELSFSDKILLHVKGDKETYAVYLIGEQGDHQPSANDVKENIKNAGYYPIVKDEYF